MRELRLVAQLADLLQHRRDGCEPALFDAGFVDIRGVEVRDLAITRIVDLGGELSPRGGGDLGAGAPLRLVRGNRVRVEPLRVGVGEEVVARRDTGLLRADIRIDRAEGDPEDSGEAGALGGSHGPSYGRRARVSRCPATEIGQFRT